MLLKNNRGKYFFYILLLVGIAVFFCSMATAHADNVIIDFFQNHVSPVDGNRCSMVPSCSLYAKQAIEKHGTVMGWIMACDRLVRCGRDEIKIAVPVRIQNYTYAYDPVEINDFWWFEKEIKE